MRSRRAWAPLLAPHSRAATTHSAAAPPTCTHAWPWRLGAGDAMLQLPQPTLSCHPRWPPARLICIYIYIILIYIYIYILGDLNVCRYVWYVHDVYMYMYMHTYMHMYVSTHTHTHTHTRTYMYKYIYIHTYMYKYIYIYVYIYIPETPCGARQGSQVYIGLVSTEVDSTNLRRLAELGKGLRYIEV